MKRGAAGDGRGVGGRDGREARGTQAAAPAN